MGDVLQVPLLIDGAVEDVRSALDALVGRACGRKRTLSWVGAVPEDVLSAGIYLHVGLRATRTTASLRRALGLVRREVLWEGGVRLVHSLGARETLEGADAAAFLFSLERTAPHVTRAIRFGTRHRVEGHLRSRGISDPAVVDVCLSLAPLSLGGIAAMLLPSLEEAIAREERRAVLVHDETLWGGLESAVDFHAFQLLPNTLGEKALSAWALDRIRELEGETVAREILDEAEATGAIYLDFSTLDEFLPRLLENREEARTVLSTEEAALTLEPLMRHLQGSHGIARCVDRDATRLGIEVAGVEMLDEALGTLFQHLGWTEEAARLSAGEIRPRRKRTSASS